MTGRAPVHLHPTPLAEKAVQREVNQFEKPANGRSVLLHNIIYFVLILFVPFFTVFHFFTARLCYIKDSPAYLWSYKFFSVKGWHLARAYKLPAAKHCECKHGNIFSETGLCCFF